MKYKDIPKLIEDGDYEVNVWLNHLETTLENYKRDYGLELNPDFQRGYVWTEDQQRKYVEFFLKGGKTARVIYFNCPYFNYGTYEEYLEGKFDHPMVCVDGLQRLTALRKFMRNELEVFDGYRLNDFEDKETMLRRLGNLRLNINSLPTKKDVLEWYIQFNTGGTVHSNEEIDRVKNMIKSLGGD